MHKINILNKLKLSLLILFTLPNWLALHFGEITLVQFYFRIIIFLVFMEVIRQIYLRTIEKNLHERYVNHAEEQNRALKELWSFNQRVSKSYFELLNYYKSNESKIYNRVLVFNEALPLQSSFIERISNQPRSAKKVLGLVDNFDGLPRQIAVLSNKELIFISGLPEVDIQMGLTLKSQNDPHHKYQKLYKIYDVFSSTVKKYDAASLIRLFHEIEEMYNFHPFIRVDFEEILYFDYSESGLTHSLKKGNEKSEVFMKDVSLRFISNPNGPSRIGILKVSDPVLINSMVPRMQYGLLEIVTSTNDIEQVHYIKKDDAESIYKELIQLIPEKRLLKIDDIMK